MASEWPEYTFAELIQSGSLEIGDGYRAKNAELGGSGPIFLRAGHLSDTHIDFDGVDRFRSELAEAVSSKMSRSGDVIITTKGNSTGRTGHVGRDLPPFVYSPHLSYWRSLDHNALIPGFLRYWARSHKFKSQLAGMAASTDMAPYLSLIDQKRLRISLPRPEEQREIARILSGLDDKIKLNREMRETLEAMARALFNSWFVDFDPVRAKAEGRDPGLPAHIADLFPDSFDESEFGLIPTGWTVAGLDEIGAFLNGVALQKYPAGSDGSLPAIKIAQLRAGNTTNADRVSKDIPPDYRVEDGDVLFSWSGSLECVIWTSGQGALNQHLFKVTSEKYPKWFFFGWIQHHLPEFRRIASAKATTMGHIQRHHLSDAMVVIPPANLLRAVAGRFDEILQASITASLQSQTLCQLRDHLLPKLIAGELRIALNNYNCGQQS